MTYPTETYYSGQVGAATAAAGDPLELVCAVDSESEHTFRWYKKAGGTYTRIEGQTGRALAIESLDASDFSAKSDWTPVYKCVATDEYGCWEWVDFYIYESQGLTARPANDIFELITTSRLWFDEVI